MKPASVYGLLDALLRTRDLETQRALVENTPAPPSLGLIEQLAAHIRQCLPKDPHMGEILTESCFLLAGRLEEPLAWAHANRSRAYVFTNVRKCAEAEPFYETAGRLFEECGEWPELGRTLIAQAENLTYLSEYTRARSLAARAHRLLEAHGDADDLAKVHIFSGNLSNRLNRYPEALEEYGRARRALGASDDHMVVAALELNRASVLVELNRFEEAIRGLETAREYCDRHEITVWADILDRNIARLYFSLGRYSDALRSLNRPRPRYRERGDGRRLALCDQACAGIYLQLNMFGEAQELAERARKTFEAYSNRFESAECLEIVGIAQSERGDPRARGTFLEAIGLFGQEGNQVAVAGMNLQLGRLEQRQGNYVAAAVLARSAAEAFEAAGLAVRGAYARLILAQSLRAQKLEAPAMEEAREALRKLGGYHARWVSYQCRDLLALLHADRGERAEAERLFREAIDDIESLRGSLELDEFRISFGKDKYQVYENLVALKAESGDTGEAFRLIERSKSRTLIDLLEHNTDSVWRSGGPGEKQQAIQRLRDELNGLYSRLAQRGATVGRAASDAALQESIRAREKEMIGLLREAGSEREGWAALEIRPESGISDVREMLSDDETLIEYYVMRDRYCAFVVDRSGDTFHRDLASAGDVRRSLKGLNFQLAKFHLSREYLADRQSQLLASTRYHLNNLYKMLVAPLEADISRRSLVVVPHGLVHYVPFQALWDGSAHLIDRYDIVYGASATVLGICREKPDRASSDDLVLAVPDEQTPAILEEAEMLGRLLPEARVFVGEAAKADLLVRYGGSAGKLHIAAHGVFRSDSPMFSSLKLADTWLSMVDVFNLRLGSELTTLSACETGMSALYGGDELLGLTRGFLYAGTPSLVVSLWRVHDRSTVVLMERFYRELLSGTSKPKALRRAALEVRSRYPHPYYWAPFILLGKSQ